MAGTNTFCQSTHGFAAGKGADCWQGTDMIPDKNEATSEKGKMGYFSRVELRQMDTQFLRKREEK